MYINRQLEVVVKDSLFDPDSSPQEPVAHARRSGSLPLYEVWLYLEGNDLPYVESVTYELDPTFVEPRRRVRRSVRNPRCALAIWTWGVFPIKATIIDKRGSVYEVGHELTYGKELERLRPDRIQYLDDTQTSSQPVFKGMIDKR